MFWFKTSFLAILEYIKHLLDHLADGSLANDYRKGNNCTVYYYLH